VELLLRFVFELHPTPPKYNNHQNIPSFLLAYFTSSSAGSSATPNQSIGPEMRCHKDFFGVIALCY